MTAKRHRLPLTRSAIVHRFTVGGTKGYIIALQSGIPLEVLVKKFRYIRFEPSGVTRNREIPMASSIIDYIFGWLERRFLSREKQAA